MPPALPASDIPVNFLRQTLIWPLALHPPNDLPPNGIPGIVLDAARKIDQDEKWHWVKDPREHLPPPVGANGTAPAAHDLDRWRHDTYAEAVYFHEFVQSFLFHPRVDLGKGDALKRNAFHLFRRTDIARAAITLHGGETTLYAKVERINLYLFRTGVAVLALEILVEAAPTLHLDKVQALLDQFRRVYVPYLHKGEPPDLNVTSVIWLDPEGKQLCESIVGAQLARHVDGVLNPKTSPIAPILTHWRHLLPETLAPDRPGSTHESFWRQVVDERIPFLATVSVTGPAQDPGMYYHGTTDADLVRLCFADGPGNGMPYDAEFLRNVPAEHFYDRYNSWGTRFLIAGYAFVAYGAGKTFDTVIATYMRRHYYQIGLLAHFEMASLLAFSSRVSRVVRETDASATAEFEQRMHAIEDDFLQFIHRFHFTGVSNHLQARELTEIWHERLGIPALMKDLHEEMESATHYLFGRAAARNADAGIRHAEVATRNSEIATSLSVIAAFGVVGALAFGLLGMNVVLNEQMMKTLRLAADGNVPSQLPYFLRQLAMLGLAFAVFGIPAGTWLKRRKHLEPRIASRLQTLSLGILVMSFVLLLASLCT